MVLPWFWRTAGFFLETHFTPVFFFDVPAGKATIKVCGCSARPALLSCCVTCRVGFMHALLQGLCLYAGLVLPILCNIF
jgi:hypothetical protein